MIRSKPVAHYYEEAARRLPEALAIYERLDDRQGAMTVIIAMGFLNWGADIHVGRGAGHHIEEIRLQRDRGEPSDGYRVSLRGVGAA